ncbi:MAG: type II secretion system protein GspM [Deltaproteobacteria bacterium]|nr:type II secretion system protein GspM [Deltaproteobacteria bacterium]
MRAFWDQLTKSQKRVVAVGAALVAGVLLLQLVLIPWFEARQRVARQIAAGEKALQDLAVLGTEYGVLQQRSEAIRRTLTKRPPGFTLFSYLDRKAGEAGVKGNVRSLNPLKATPAGAYEEAAVEMKLDKLTMKQLADFFYLLESPEEMIRIRKASIAKMKESPEYISALIQVFTYQPLTPAGGR